MTDLFCPYCGRTAELKDSAVIYCGTSYGMAWVCSGFPECDAYVGCHIGMFDVETCVRVVELCRERSESKEKRA